VKRTSGWLLLVIGTAAALFSGYGWWFHFSVGPSHGPGREVGIVAGVVSVVSLALAWRLGRRRRSMQEGHD